MTGILQSLLGSVSSAVSAVTDAYFNLVTLLLPGNGTNGAQNNTFLDSSSNNFTITRNGNTTQGTFSPFSQTGWSNFFTAASSQTIGFANNNAFKFGAPSGNTNDFVVEFFVYSTTTSISLPVGTGYTSGTTYWNFNLNRTAAGANTAGYVQFYLTDNFGLTATTGLNANQWNHICAVRTGTTVSLFVNGTRGATGTSSVDPNPTGSMYVGGDAFSLGRYLDGYVSNLRIIKGSTLPYDAGSSSITVPTAQLTTVTGTTVLTCQSNRFIDNSSNGLAITFTGTPSVQAFSPFAPTAAYSAATVGGSGYFDGTGDYLGIATGGSTLSLNGDFTVELWCYLTTTAGIRSPLANTGVASGTGTFTLVLGGGLTQLDFYIGSSSAAFGSTNLRLNEWTHIAIIRSGTGTNNVKVYKNGVFQIQQSNNSTYLLDTFAIGAYASGTNFWVGNIGQVRIVKGQALCSGDFTPPTAPVTTTSVGWTGANAASSITGTVPFLANFTNAGITDATSKNDLETVGNAQISTAQSKFGGSSIYLDGTGDYLTLPTTNQSLTFGSANWTIEFWIYLPSLPNTRKEILYLNGNTSGYAAVALHICSNNKLGLSFSESGSGWKTDDTTGVGTALSATTWQYVAVTRNGQNIQIYLDGAAQGSAYTTTASTTSLMTTYTLNEIGTYNTSSFQLNAYIDDLRITLGQVRTVTTSPTAAFPLQ